MAIKFCTFSKPMGNARATKLRIPTIAKENDVNKCRVTKTLRAFSKQVV